MPKIWSSFLANNGHMFIWNVSFIWSLRKCRKIPIIIKNKMFEFNYNTKVYKKNNKQQPIVCYFWSVSLIKKNRTRFQSWSVAKKVLLTLSFIISWDYGKPYIFCTPSEATYQKQTALSSHYGCTSPIISHPTIHPSTMKLRTMPAGNIQNNCIHYGDDDGSGNKYLSLNIEKLATPS